jgi:2-dehydro-3-deoxyphosphogluconate aldolase / (4S)-4-hydroxy-2-oxoglutarate aldolase
MLKCFLCRGWILRLLMKFRCSDLMNWLERLKQQRVIAVIRAPSYRLGLQMAKAVAAGGIKLIEITADSDRAWDLIPELQQELPDCVIGTGTILTNDQWSNAVKSGAQFMFSPHVDVGLIGKSRSIGIPMIPGAFSPTEIVTAWQAGAASVKVFPIQCLGGADYIRAICSPLGQIPLIPTGGVNLLNAQDLIEAGAIAVGLAGSLFPKKCMEEEDWGSISTIAKDLIESLKPQSI